MNDACLIAARIPLERELEDRLGFFIHLRWLAGVVILAGAALAPCRLCGVSARPLLIIGAGVLVYNALFALEHRHLRDQRQSHYRGQIYAQMGLDWIALALLVHYTGGISGPAALAFAFHIIIGALLLSSRAAFLQAGLAAVLLGGLTAAELYGGDWLARPTQVCLLQGETEAIVLWRRWLVLSGFLGVVSLLTRSIVARLGEKERALVDSEVRLERAYREMQALYDLGQLAHATRDRDRVLSLIAESATRLTGRKGCAIGLLDEAGEALLPGAAFGLSEGYLEKGPVQVARSGMVAQALAGEVVQIDDIASDDRLQYPERARREGIRSVVCIGLHLRDRAIGVLRVYAADSRRLRAQELSFLRNLSNLAAVAIANANTYAETLALSEERAWLARVTHHQLRAPLAVMRGLLDALPYAGRLSDKQADLTLRARRRVDELLALVADLLDLANAQRPSHHLSPEPVALAEALAPALETVREQATQKGVDLRVEDLEPLTVAAEAEDVRRIFANLLDNAVKYTAAGGRVELSGRRRGSHVQVQVTDTGIGIDPEERERVLRGFYRTEAARATQSHGTGVGLSIVQRLARRWQGTMKLESTPGEGSVFTVTLPAAHGTRAATEEGKDA